jgi:hypothetical protein
MENLPPEQAAAKEKRITNSLNPRKFAWPFVVISNLYNMKKRNLLFL